MAIIGPSGNGSGRYLFLNLVDGKGYAFEGSDGGQDEDGTDDGEKVLVELSDTRKLGIVTFKKQLQEVADLNMRTMDHVFCIAVEAWLLGGDEFVTEQKTYIKSFLKGIDGRKKI